MSAVRVQKIFEAMSNQIKKLGGYSADWQDALIWQGQDASGKDAVVIDFDGSSWSTANRRVILVAMPASDANNTAQLKTQSHAQGMFIDGSVWFKAYCETPLSWTGEHAAFLRKVQQHILGQLGAPMQLVLTANGTEPAVEGVNGAGLTSTSTEAEKMLPYGLTYPGGV